MTEQDKRDAAVARERRYQATEARVRDELEPAMARDALAALARCPRRSGLPALGAYFCECPACTPDLWFGADED